MKLIENWIEKELVCACCRSTESIKYEDDFGRVICEACNIRVNERIEFVHKCGELLNIAKPSLTKCELKLGKDIPANELMHERFVPDDEYVLIMCANGYTYKLLVEANSLVAIAEEIFKSMANK